MPAANAGTGVCRSPPLLGSNHIRSEHGRRAHHGAWSSAFQGPPALEALEIISIVEAGDHEDTSLSIVSADKAAESGEAPRNREECVARNGVGSNRMRTRVRVIRRHVDWSETVNAGIRNPGSGVDDAE